MYFSYIRKIFPGSSPDFSERGAAVPGGYWFAATYAEQCCGHHLRVASRFHLVFRHKYTLCRMCGTHRVLSIKRTSTVPSDGAPLYS